MKKIILLMATLSINAYAIHYTTQNQSNINNSSTSNNEVKIEEYMKTKVGLVSVINPNSIIINKKEYQKSVDFRYYGVLKNNSYVKFNTNKLNQIIDLWVLK